MNGIREDVWDGATCEGVGRMLGFMVYRKEVFNNHYVFMPPRCACVGKGAAYWGTG